MILIDISKVYFDLALSLNLEKIEPFRPSLPHFLIFLETSKSLRVPILIATDFL